VSDFSHCFNSIAQTTRAMQRGELTSEQLVERQLQQIRRFDDKLHAFIDVYEADAMAAAIALDQLRIAGTTLGPLHGVTVAVKDLFDIKGKPITGGSKSMPPRISEITATAVHRMRQAGAIVIGKTQTVEYAFGGWGTNTSMGTPWNPWDLHVHRVPGGSSSGSAVAVAAGMATASIGTDTGGSVRIPAGLCNLVGLKTTQGLISRHGLVELCPTHDTVGPLARTVEDAAILLDVMSGPDPLDPASAHAPSRRISDQIRLPVEGLRLWALPDSERAGVEGAVLDCYDRALQVLASRGVQLVYRDLPRSCVEYMGIAGSLMSAEGYSALGPLFEREDLEFDQNVRRRILLGRDISSADYLALLKERQNATNEMYAAMDGIDVCAFPTNPISAIPLVDVDELATPLSRFGRFVNLLNLSSVAVPCGFTRSGLPISIQFIGRPLHESLVMRVGHAYERATTWHQQVPQGLM
jgi:aspartyl-tRNA(Asn)/glutamyl-tRNA(Gln) amidotransferase subunit A